MNLRRKKRGEKMRQFILHLLGALWCLCWAIPIWLIYILPMWLIFKELEFVEWDGPFIACFVLTKEDGEPYRTWHQKLWRNWGGVGLPCAYIVKYKTFMSKQLEEGKSNPYITKILRILRQHEKRHVLQWFVFGPLFPLVYILGMYAGLAHGDHYNLNPLEMDAVKASTRREDV